jgi:hypothetical protein
MFLRNVRWLSTCYTSLYPTIQSFSWPPLWAPQILQDFMFDLTFWQRWQNRVPYFFVATMYTSIEIHRYFRGMYCLYLQGKRASRTSTRQKEIRILYVCWKCRKRGKLLAACVLYASYLTSFSPWRCKQYMFPKHWYLPNFTALQPTSSYFQNCVKCEGSCSLQWKWCNKTSYQGERQLRNI